MIRPLKLRTQFIPMLVLGPLLGSQALFAQERTSQPMRFQGSMVLEVPFEGLEALKNGESKEVNTLNNFICDDTSLQALTLMRLPRGGHEKSSFQVDVLVFVRPSFDRMVGLFLTLMDGDREISSMAMTGIRASETRVSVGHGAWEMKADELKALGEEGHHPKLKILMKVVPND